MNKKILILSLLISGSVIANNQVPFDENANYNPEIYLSNGNDNRLVDDRQGRGGPLAVRTYDKSFSIDSNVKTAAEQGFSFDPVETEEEKAHRIEQETNARQQAIPIEIPNTPFAVGKQAKYKKYLRDWTKKLKERGIEDKKIKFEANRLTKDEFESWAVGVMNSSL